MEQDESCATWEPSWDRPRLERRELLALGGKPRCSIRTQHRKSAEVASGLYLVHLQHSGPGDLS